MIHFFLFTITSWCKIFSYLYTLLLNYCNKIGNLHWNRHRDTSSWSLLSKCKVLIELIRSYWWVIFHSKHNATYYYYSYFECAALLGIAMHVRSRWRRASSGASWPAESAWPHTLYIQLPQPHWQERADKCSGPVEGTSKYVSLKETQRRNLQNFIIMILRLGFKTW